MTTTEGEDKPFDRVGCCVRLLCRVVFYGSDAKPPQTGFARRLPLLDLRFAPVGKGSDAKEGTGPPQSELSLVQLPLLDLRFAPVGKGSDAYQTIYRDTNEKSSCISDEFQ